MGVIPVNRWGRKQLDLIEEKIDEVAGGVSADFDEVDNTSDADKPVSTLQAAALALKANLASPTFTGEVTVPTPTAPGHAVTKAYADDLSITGGTPDADASTKGKLQIGGGDLGGTAAAVTVEKIKGVTLPVVAPTTGQVLSALNATSSDWIDPPSVTPADGSITAAKLSFDPATQTELDAGLAGKLGSTATAADSTKVGGVAISGIPTSGQSPIASDGTTAVWGTPSTAIADGSIAATKLSFDVATQAELDAETTSRVASILTKLDTTAAAADTLKLNGISVTGAAALGNFLKATSTTDAHWAPGHIFNVVDYGAVIDGKRLLGAAASTSSASVTVTGGTFTSDDIGKKVCIFTVSAAGAVTTISSVTDGTHIVLAANAGINTTSGNGYIIWGTDDSTAIAATFTAAAAKVANLAGTDYNVPMGTGNVGVVIPSGIQAMIILGSQMSIPAGVILDAQATPVNMLASRNTYCVDVRPFAVIRRLVVEGLFGGGVTCGDRGQQAHIKIEHLGVWHTSGSSTAVTTLAGSTSTTGGTLTANTRYYCVTAIDATGGESAASNEISITSTGSTSSNSLTWDAYTGAASYRIYRGTSASGESLYFTSATNSFTDVNGANSPAYVIAPGTALRLYGSHYELGDLFLKTCTLGIYQNSGTDTVARFVYLIGCKSGIRLNASNQVHYPSVFLDTCGATVAFGGVGLGGIIVDNATTNFSFKVQAFNIAGTSGTLDPVINIGPITGNAKNINGTFQMQANNTGGKGVVIANAADVTIKQLLSNTDNASSITTDITTAVTYGASLSNEIAIESTLSTGITPESGTRIGSHKFVQGGNSYNQGANNLLASITGINAKTVATTTLYTVPTGRTAVITGAVIRCTLATAITVGPALGIGVASGEDDIFASTALATLLDTTKFYTFTTSGINITAAAAAVIKLGIDTAATGTTQTIAVDLLGYLV